MTNKSRTATQHHSAQVEPTPAELHEQAVANDEKRIRAHKYAEYIGVGLLIASAVATYIIGVYALSDIANLPTEVAYAVIFLCACVPAILFLHMLHSDSTRGLIENRISLSKMSIDFILGIKIGVHQFFIEHMHGYNAESGEIDMAQELYRGVGIKKTRIQEVQDLIVKGFTELGLKGPLQDIMDLPAQGRMVTKMVEKQTREYEELPPTAELADVANGLSAGIDSLKAAKAVNSHPAE